MRYAVLVFVGLFAASCSKSDGQICIDNYLDMFDRANPDASSGKRTAFKRMVTVQCTDPSY